MEGCGVIVRYSQEVDGTKEETSCSGVHLGYGTIITHGTVLMDLIKHPNFRPMIQELQVKGYCGGEASRSTLDAILKSLKSDVEVIMETKEHKDDLIMKSKEGNDGGTMRSNNDTPTSFLGYDSKPKMSMMTQNDLTMRSKEQNVDGIMKSREENDGGTMRSNNDTRNSFLGCDSKPKMSTMTKTKIMRNAESSTQTKLGNTKWTQNELENTGSSTKTELRNAESTQNELRNAESTQNELRNIKSILNQLGNIKFNTQHELGNTGAAKNGLGNAGSTQNEIGNTGSSTQTELGNTESTRNELVQNISVSARIHSIFVESTVQEGLDSLVPSSQGWKLLEDDTKRLSLDLERLVMSSFVVLTLHEDSGTENHIYEGAREALARSAQPRKGQFVYVESSPFGHASPSVFLNSLSHGIVSNVRSKNDGVFLSDARCVLGSEGAPVFTVLRGDRYLCGLVVSPFCWLKGEWLGLTLLVSIRPVLKSILKIAQPSPSRLDLSPAHHTQEDSSTSRESRFISESSMQGLLDGGGNGDGVCKSVVCITYGGVWGSGFVVWKSPGIIITCAHVVQKAVNKVVDVYLSDGTKVQGRVIHKTNPLINSSHGNRESKQQQQPTTTTTTTNYSMWDLGVVMTNSSLTHSLTLATTLPPKGSSVVTAGYGVFPHQVLPTASVSRGVISKVVTVPSTLLKLPRSITSGPKEDKHTQAGTLNLADTLDGKAVVCHFKSIEKDSMGLKQGRETRNFDLNTHDRKAVVCHYKSVSEDSSGSSEGHSMFRRVGSCSRKRFEVPVILQTTCAVYSGASGGPLLAPGPSGGGVQVVGVIVCNMQQDSHCVVTYPNVNLAIPVPTIAHIINTFIHTRDESVLKFLDMECGAASDLWALTQPIQSHL